MIEKVEIKHLNCFMGNHVFNELDKEYVDKIAKEKKYEKHPILIDYKNSIIDGHHRYLAADRNGETHIDCFRLNIPFIETDILRDFQKHLKGMVPEDWDPATLKDEFEQVLTWLIKTL